MLHGLIQLMLQVMLQIMLQGTLHSLLQATPATCPVTLTYRICQCHVAGYVMVYGMGYVTG